MPLHGAGHEGLKIICPGAAFRKLVSSPIPRHRVLRAAPNPGLHEGGARSLGDIVLLGVGDPERWKRTLKPRPPGHEFQGKTFFKDSVKK